uniref:Uncharacterized protein n=1 Tax=Arundo donax TaxID=35708 RepID=A0A0A9BEX4_ARUDO
MFSKEPDHG